MRFKKLDHALEEIERLEKEAQFGQVALESALPFLTELEDNLAELVRENRKLQEDLDRMTREYEAIKAAHRFETEKRRFYQDHPLVKLLKPVLGKFNGKPPEGVTTMGDSRLEGQRRRIGLGGLKGNLDYPQKRFERIRQEAGLFSGWFLDGENRPARRVTILHNQQKTECVLHQHRSDIREVFPELPPSAESCGFQGRIELPVGLNKIEVLIEPVDGEAFVGFVRDLLYIPGVDDSFAQQQALYRDWVERFDSPSADTLERYGKAAQQWSYRPLVSVVIPVYNPDLALLEEAVTSVREQVYDRWELLLVNDDSPNAEVRPALDALAEEDARIRVIHRDRNGGISRATQTGVDEAAGEWVAFFDQDDLLRPQSLYFVVLELQRNPEAGLVYTDEDKVDGEGERFEPYFKPDWNPELLCSQNYISHLSVIRKDHLREAGPLDPEFDGAQDWDLILRVTERLGPEQIVHVHRILYHWRASEGSTAWHEGEKDTFETSRGVLMGHLKRCGEAGEVDIVDQKYYRIRRGLPERAPKVEILIPTRDRADDLRTCIRSIREKTDYPAFRITVLNNRSADPATFTYFNELEAEGVQVLPYNEPFNFSAINNFGVERTDGPVLALLNNDLEVMEEDWLRSLVGEAIRPEIGVVGCKLLYGNRTIQHAGVVLGVGGVAGHAFKYLPEHYDGQMMRPNLTQNYSAVTAACCVVRREVFEAVGGLDAEHLAVAFNDIDFCLRVREAGYRNVYVPTPLYHHESRSRGPENTREKQERFLREVDYMKERWGRLLEEDPSYNLNLTLDKEDFSFASAPRHRYE